MNFLSFLSPWKYYLAAGLLIASAYGGYSYRGIQVNELKLNAVVLEQQRAEIALSYTQAMQDIANQTEKQNYENQKKHNSELAYYRSLVDKSGGLYDHPSVSSNSGVARGTNGNKAATSGDGLSEEVTEPLSKETTDFLLEQANLADQVVDQFLTCQQYVHNVIHYKGK